MLKISAAQYTAELTADREFRGQKPFLITAEE
jgi:hypothetical protein